MGDSHLFFSLLITSNYVLTQEDKEDEDEAIGSKGSLTVWDSGASAGGVLDYGPYGDSESKAFYEDLPDLLSMVPLGALGISPEQAAALREEWKTAKELRLLGPQSGAQEQNTMEETGSTEGDVIDDGDRDREKDDDKEVIDDSASTSKKEENQRETDTDGDTPHTRVLLLLQERLPECITKQRCDEFCASFCYLNSKSARKKLVQALMKLPRSRIDLAATYAR